MFQRHSNGNDRKVRYAVVGLGWIAQEAVLPAFKHAEENSELTALVSDDPTKLRELGEKYGVKNLFSYDEYDTCLRSGQIDAVFIALPNSLHREYTVRAAEAGIHILCEKPIANTSADAEAMIAAAASANVRLMIAYRLHFEEANMKAVEIAQSGELGGLRFFNAVNSQQVESGNIRLDKELSGGPLEDMGIYCLNAARYIFRAEPIEVMAFAASTDNPRFDEVHETISVIMRFPEERLATFTTGFGMSDTSWFQVTGTKGDLRVEPGFSFHGDLKHYLTVDGKTKTSTFGSRDQFTVELIQFSDAVLKNVPVEPSGEEGLVDIRIIEAIHRSIETHQPVSLEGLPQRSYRPSLAQEMKQPAPKKAELVHAESPKADAN